MTLKRQLLLVSLLALMLPWAGCEFIRETESALRAGQQHMLAGQARALADALSAYTEQYPTRSDDYLPSEQAFVHTLSNRPEIDGYFDDWLLDHRAQETIRGADGPIQIALGAYQQTLYIYLDVKDRSVVFANSQSGIAGDGPRFADRITMISSNPPYLEDHFVFSAEAPGRILSYRQSDSDRGPEDAISAYWQDVPGGYRLEASIPVDLLGTHLGFVVHNTLHETEPATRSSSFSGNFPAPMVSSSATLRDIADKLTQSGTRVIITDAAGWRIAGAGRLSEMTTDRNLSNDWSSRIYDLLVEDGKDYESAEPHPSGREQQPYVSAALNGQEMASWFRGEESGRAIVAVATPIRSDGEVLGALVLQQGTEAILSSTNAGLTRLINLTLVTTLLVAATLIGYASWLSRRIRHLSVAAEMALENETLHAALPSALAVDEIGDLSRSFSFVLQQLGDYNEYLRTLASKLSHELRTPLAIVTSSLENLEHEALDDASAGYTARAREGADRLRRILGAMSEASRVEELMRNAEPERFDLFDALQSTTTAYQDAYSARQFVFDTELTRVPLDGSPELLIQMLDKLVDNAVDFSDANDTITIALELTEHGLFLSVHNPGPELPERMRTQMFDSMVSMRGRDNTRHLGLGLYVAKLIAEGHGGSIAAENVAGGVRFQVRLPTQDSR